MTFTKGRPIRWGGADGLLKDRWVWVRMSGIRLPKILRVWAWVCFYFFALFGVALQPVGVTGRRVRVSPLAELGFVSDFRLMSVSRR